MEKKNARGRKGLSDKICLGVYITKETHGKLVEIAEKEELTLSDIVRKAVKEFIANR